jgi:hypothetical protein
MRDNVDTYILKHGTSQSRLPSIYSEGLVPRRDRGNWFRDSHSPSLEGFVYLAQTYFMAELHAARTAILTGSGCAIVEVEVSEYHLYPDESYFTDKTVLSKLDVAAAQDRVISNRLAWLDCLATRYMVSHEGPISPNKIVNLLTFPVEKSLYYAYVKNMPKMDIDHFDLGFEVHTRAADWMKSLELDTDEVEVLRNLEIIPLSDLSKEKDREFEVRLFDHEMTLVFKA